MAMVNINLELYKFLEAIEVRRDGEEIVTAWIPLDSIEIFKNIIGDSYFDEGGLECRLQGDCIALDIYYILDNEGEIEVYKDVISDYWNY